MEGIKSTHAVTYIREDRSVRNHIYPWIHPKKGIIVNDFKSEDRVFGPPRAHTPPPLND